MAKNRKSQATAAMQAQDLALLETGEISKSQLKREAQSKKDLASELIGLGNKQFAGAPLDEGLREEIRDARKITAHVARKRQLMFVAKKLRIADTSEIEQYLENLKSDASHLTVRHHRAESWRDFMLSDGDDALAEFIRLRPDADRQALRQLLRKAKQEVEAGKPPAAARLLFRMIRALDGATSLPPCP